MGVEDATDRAAFVDTGDFGVSALYNGSDTISVVFDNEFLGALEGEANVAVEATEPRAIARTADVPSAAQGDTLVIGGVTYNVVGVEADGTGMTTLVLEDQS